MSEVIASPVELLDRAEIKDGAPIVEYSRTEAALADLRTRYTGAKFDLTTTAGDKAARAARQELVTVRANLEKKRKELKAPALQFGQLIDAEAERITAEIQALETPIDAQIKADEKRRAEEKAERERLAAERVEAFRKRIAAIRSCAVRAQGIESTRIQAGIDQVSAIVTDADTWAEFTQEAALAKNETLKTMRELFDAAHARELEAAKVEAQRVENERIAEGLAAQKRELEEQAAALKRQQLEAAQKVAAEQAAARAISQAAAPAATATAAPAPVSAPVAAPAAPVVARPAPVAADTGERINLGQINERIAPLSITAAGLSELGFEHVATERASKLYAASQLHLMRTAMAKHLLRVEVTA